MNIKKTLSKNVFAAQYLSAFFVYVVFMCIFTAGSAHAAFPGLNGKVVFESDRDGNNEIYTMRQDGSDVKRLTNDSGTDQNAAWSPDGMSIAFVSDRDGDEDIYIMDAGGNNVIQLTDNIGSDSRPDISPDKTKIVFMSNRDGDTDIFVMDINGDNQFNLTNNLDVDAHPVWSPDGTKIALTSNRDGDTEIYVMDTDGTNIVQLTNNAISDSAPDWSPDGTKLVFQTRTGSNRAVGRVNIDGAGFIELTPPMSNLANPFYFPGGEHIGFNATNGYPDQDLYFMNADGSNIQRLSDHIARDAIGSIQPLIIPPSTLNTFVSLSAVEEESITYDAPANHSDTYESIDPTSVVITTDPQKGTTSVSPTTGLITYIPNQNQTGSDSFTYQICSSANEELCTTATVGVVLGDATLVETGVSTHMGMVLSTLCIFALVFSTKKSQKHNRQ